MASNIVVPNPKDIVTTAMTNMTQLKTTIWATQMDIMLGTWQGPNNDVVQAVSMPAFLVAQAIDSMQIAKNMGEAQKKEDQTNLIMLVLGIVFAFLPFVGEALEFADGLAMLTRALMLVADAGNVGLGIADVIQHPGDAPVIILSTLLGLGGANRNPDKFATMAAEKAAMADADMQKVGPVFKARNDKLQSVLKGCAK
jgi:hypothetical protein